MKRVAERGLSLLEVIAVIAVSLLIAMILIPPTGVPKNKARRIKCTSNLKNVGLAFRIFATDNDGQFPDDLLRTNHAEVFPIDAAQYFLSLTNELSTPVLVHCPSDKRKMASSFTNFNSKNVSYFVSLSTGETTPNTFLAGDRNLEVKGRAIAPGPFDLTTNLPLSWSKDLHHGQGNIVMADGSVQQFDSTRLNRSNRLQDVATNHLLIP
jgi:prepilin-type processing-associated H-X9-DG protein